MIIYLLIGIVWLAWLEMYTTKNLDGVLGRAWTNRERLFHCLLWPYSLGTFIYTFINSIFGNKDEE
jgi:hypothetical protein